MFRRTISLITTTFLLATMAATASADPAEICETQKRRAVAKYTACRYKADAKAAKKGTAPDYGRCVAQIDTSFGRAEARAGDGVCRSEDDVSKVLAEVDGSIGYIYLGLGGGGYTNICGDGVIGVNESCDGIELNDQSCEGLGFSSGNLACTAGCGFDVSGCVNEPQDTCGNGLLDGNESCDGSSLGGETCEGLGFASGTLACTVGCGFDLTDCVSCPQDDFGAGRNGMDDSFFAIAGTSKRRGFVSLAEVCEIQKRRAVAKYTGCRYRADAKAAKKEATPDYARCVYQMETYFGRAEVRAGAGGCQSEDDVSHVMAEVDGAISDIYYGLAGGGYAHVCGDGVVEGAESCDSENLAGLTCEILGFSSGPLGCTAGCGLDVTECVNNPREGCGNGIIDGNESCDGSAVGEQTCESLGYASGVLACTAGCGFDFTNCVSFLASGCGPGPNLIVNGDFEAGNAGFGSEYSFGSINSGSARYNVLTDPRIDHPQATSYGDRTTGAGLMMAANGSPAPRVVWSQSVEVNPHADYSFSMFVSTWYPLAPAVLEVSSAELGNLGTVTAPSATGAWEEFQVGFNSGGNSTLTLRVISRSIEDTGNDFALDDLSLRQISPPFGVLRTEVR